MGILLPLAVVVGVGVVGVGVGVAVGVAVGTVASRLVARPLQVGRTLFPPLAFVSIVLPWSPCT